MSLESSIVPNKAIVFLFFLLFFYVYQYLVTKESSITISLPSIKQLASYRRHKSMRGPGYPVVVCKPIELPLDTEEKWAQERELHLSKKPLVRVPLITFVAEVGGTSPTVNTSSNTTANRKSIEQRERTKFKPTVVKCNS
ncbi:uncharacterized protein B0J16DRAFT_321967 [Fusarium flagelliforme]|uniref:uncharacterized protein n=1 Tax=Fusarium flagelliforme TaxID=2675880 RepID=UPI001E8EE615|nr:uncharacterized protein B0J16DRAFT_321967 [Fusarium flagelliforme]KAH7183226.1 hypothetical protein B0J16DRAFT_321967 [Fusarium flagelliforme]